MNIKCPYCGCEYNLKEDNLPKPIGNERLGYGWWLRCFKCHKKWWLGNSVVQSKMMDQISVGREDILRKLHKMKKKNKKIPCNNKNKFIKKRYIVLFILMTILGLCYFNKDFFMEYIHHKIDRLSTNLISKLKLQDVKYLLENTENHDKISMIVTGKILNEDDLVLKVRGVRVVVYDQNNVEIVSWDDNIKEGFIVSGDVVDFRTIHDIPRFSGNIRVDVSLI